jgi:hypothetical protein
MDQPLFVQGHDILEGSELLQAVAAVAIDGGAAFALGRLVRPLSAREIEQLERQGNTAADWSRMLVSEDFSPVHIRRCEFLGGVVLGRFARPCQGPAGLDLPAGLCNSTIADCVIGDDAVIRDVKLLAGYVIGSRAAVFDCGQVVCSGETTFGNGAEIAVGVETGGRRVPIHAELNVRLAWLVAQSGGRHALGSRYAAAVREYAARASSRRGIIEREARLLNTPRVLNAYLGPYAEVSGATVVADATLLSNRSEPTRITAGACVTGSLLQWGSSVETLAIVERSLLTEHSHVEHHARVTNSILGPNTAVGSGEVTSCLLGPFVACHHQSLLIATLWPEGKGNVAYGANVGSNHTSRAPDQEFRAGEGMFFGLGVNVKFPSDFSRAPYTVVACGASLLPQRMEFPFSLIATPSRQLAGVSPACMEIFPGWVLGENLYALRRNELKFRTRDRARRGGTQYAILRPDTVDLMRDALERLEDVRPGLEFYTESEIKGLGKNFLMEEGRRRAVRAYRLFIRYCALLGLKERLANCLADPLFDPAELLERPGQDQGWEHQRRILVEEGIADVAAGLLELVDLLGQLSATIGAARRRDEQRGSRIMDDYASVHPPVDEDELVRQVRQETEQHQAEIEDLWRRCRHTSAGGPKPHLLPTRM